MNGAYKGKVPKTHEGERLDKVLASLFPELSRTLARKLIGRGAVRVNGTRVRVASRAMSPGDLIQCVDDPRVEEKSENPLDVVHWGQGFVVVRKVPGQLVQGTRGGDVGTLERLLRETLRDPKHEHGPVENIHVVHRLDAGAQGLVVVATEKKTASVLTAQLQEKSLHRVYWALVEGIPEENEGVIDLPLGPVIEGKVEVDNGGRESRTHWRVLRTYGPEDLSLLELRLETGRSHQIRVHLAESIAPILGDWRYGAEREVRGLRLAAVELAFYDKRRKKHSFVLEPLPSFFPHNLSS